MYGTHEDVGKSNPIDEATGSFRPIFKKWYDGGVCSKPTWDTVVVEVEAVLRVKDPACFQVRLSIHRQNGGVNPDGIYPICKNHSTGRRMSRRLVFWQMTPEDALRRLWRFRAYSVNVYVTVGLEEVPVDFDS